MSPIYDHPLDTCTISMPAESTEDVNPEFSRLIHAAIINKKFCDMLLKNPVQSIDNGYYGESFHFNKETRERINTVRASSLAEFAQELLQISHNASVKEVLQAQYS